MAALGGSRHALINLSTQIDIPPIIKKSLSPATGYFGHKDEQSHHLNTFYVSFASVCALQTGAFCILQNFFQRNFCFRPAFEKVVCIITRKGEVLPPFDRKEVRTWNLIAENFKSNVPFKVSVNGCCTTKRATPTPKSNGRKLPITELARPFFLKQLAMQEVQKEQAAKDGKPYYDNDLVVAKPDGAPIAASWVSSQFGKLLEDLDMPHIRFHDLRHTAATNMHQLTGDFYTVGEVLGHTLAGIGASLGLSMNFEAVTARYVDVRLERKKEVLDAYHSAVEKAAPEKPKEAEPKKGKRAAKKKHSEIDL